MSWCDNCGKVYEADGSGSHCCPDCRIELPGSPGAGERGMLRDIADVLGFVRDSMVSPQQAISDIRGMLGIEKTDGPEYNAGRLEGHADVCAELRSILDPEDMNHWNKDGLLKEVARLLAKERSR